MIDISRDGELVFCTPVKIGNVVVLNAPAPSSFLMTITAINGTSVRCDWSEEGDIKSRNFHYKEIRAP